MTARGIALVNGMVIALEASSTTGLRNMVRSIGFVDRTPSEVVEKFEGYDHFHATVTDRVITHV